MNRCIAQSPEALKLQDSKGDWPRPESTTTAVSYQSVSTAWTMSSYLVDYPFANRLYPGALDVLERMCGRGRTVILSDGLRLSAALLQPQSPSGMNSRKTFALGMVHEYGGGLPGSSKRMADERAASAASSINFLAENYQAGAPENALSSRMRRYSPTGTTPPTMP
jgi:hypothetical protein